MLGELKIEDYSALKHLKHIYEWLKARKLPEELLHDLPSVGTIALYKEIGVAAAFLRRMEGCLGTIDCLITNPEALPHLRHEAIDRCVESILSKAKAGKMKKVLAWTIDPSVLKRSVKHGFKRTDQIMIGIDLEET